uniref:SAM-dependent methyltransferase n=1 Tax=Heterorhabditis bacteriophora TaxID=37862 RepID=A0A1I7XG85_HETBA
MAYDQPLLNTWGNVYTYECIFCCLGDEVDSFNHACMDGTHLLEETGIG